MAQNLIYISFISHLYTEVYWFGRFCEVLFVLWLSIDVVMYKNLNPCTAQSQGRLEWRSACVCFISLMPL